MIGHTANCAVHAHVCAAAAIALHSVTYALYIFQLHTHLYRGCIHKLHCLFTDGLVFGMFSDCDAHS